MVLDVFRQRVNLKRQSAAAHRIEKIEANRELVAEPRVNRVAEQHLRLVKHKVK